jgi:beta-glucosidase
LFDNPYRFLDEKREKEVIGSKANREAVLDMAKKSIVLLKNDTNLLPQKIWTKNCSFRFFSRK